MLHIDTNKINKNYDKINIDLYKINNKLNNDCNFLEDYLQKYIENINIKKLLKNYKVINEPNNIDPYMFINKKYLLDEEVLLGQGAFGKVYKLSNNNVVKIESLYNIYSLKRKLNELKISKIAGKYKIGPKIYKNEIVYNIFNGNIFFLTYMEYIEGITFQKYNEDKNKSVEDINKIKKIIKIKKNLLHKLGFIHDDFHKGNIMIKIKNNKIIDVYIIDYGLSKKIDNMNSINEYNNNSNIFNKKLNYFIKKKYIEVSCSDKISKKINEIYNIILLNKDIGFKQINSIYNVNLLSDSIIRKFINKKSLIKVNKNIQIKKIFKNIYNIEDLVNKKYIVYNEVLENEFENYKFFQRNYNIFKMYYVKDKNNNEYLCIIYNIYYNNNIEETIKFNFDMSKKLCKAKFGLNIIEYNFMKYKDDLLLSYYIKLEKSSLTHNFLSIKNIKINIIENYIGNLIKKLIDLKVYFKYYSVRNIKNDLFLYNNNIYYFNILNLYNMKNLIEYKNYDDYNNDFNDNQKTEFIYQLIQNNLITSNEKINETK